MLTVSLSNAFHNKENNSTRAALAISFRKNEIDDSSFVEHVTSGKAFSPAIFRDNYRKADNFLEASLIGLDFDLDVSTDDLANHEYAALFWLVYATPSSTIDHPKSRAIIKLSNPVTDAKEYENLVAGLLELFADLRPDSAAKDCSRFFYGSDTDDYKLLGNVVSVEQLKALLPETKTFTVPVKTITPHRAIDDRFLTNGGSAWGLGALRNELNILAQTGEGKRNQQLFRSSAALAELVAGGELDEIIVRENLMTAALDIGLDRDEIKPTIDSAFKHGLENPRVAPVKEITRYELNDIGNKNRFVDKYGNDLMFVPEFDKWFIWNNVCWSEDEINQVQQMAESISIDLFTEARSLNGHERTSRERHALVTGNKMRLNNMLDLAKQPLSVLSHQLDTNPMLFCVENAVIDLKTGKPIEATRNQNITKQAKVLFNENAECPKFLQYLTDAMNGDTEMVSFIQRLVGY